MTACAWCRDPDDNGDTMTEQGYRRLCRAHKAEYEGVSLDGLNRMYAGERADMTDLGYYD